MSDRSDAELCRVRQATDAHQELRRRLLEMSRLSEQQSQVPTDRPDALLALLDRKQQLLRAICEANAPGLFGDSATLAGRCDRDGPDLVQARRHLRAEAGANLRLWEQLVESEGRARSHCAACLEQLGPQLAAVHRKAALRRAYAAGGADAATARFVDRLR